MMKLRRTAEKQVWELVHPRCALERKEDMEEVYSMIELGEVDVAMDELRWLLQGCSDFVDAHRLLGELALMEGDLPLARGHFGYAYDCVFKALPTPALDGTLPYRLKPNQSFHEAGKGLAHCLFRLNKLEQARSVVACLTQLDPTDPLEVSQLEASSTPRPPSPFQILGDMPPADGLV